MSVWKGIVSACKGGAAELKRTASLVGSALMAALNVVLNSFTVPIGNLLEIGFALVSLAACAYMYGPWLAGIAGAVADVIGYMLRPSGGFFPGFTLNELVRGILFGFWFYKQPVRLWRVSAACVLDTAIISFLLNPIWLNTMYGAPFFSQARAVTALLKLPFSIALIYCLLKALEAMQKHRGALQPPKP